MKKSIFKRILSLILSVCVIVTVFTVVGVGSLTASAETPKMLALHTTAWKSVYQEVVATKFTVGAQYKFSIDLIYYKIGNTAGDRLRIRAANSSGNWGEAIPTTCTPGTNNYTATFTAQYSASGTAFQIWLYIRDSADYFVVGNPELYKLDSNGNKVGNNLILDPGFNTEISDNNYTSTDNPWFTTGSGLRPTYTLTDQTDGCFGVNMMLAHKKGWQYVYQELPGYRFEVGAQYKFSIDAIYMRRGSDTGNLIYIKNANSSGGWNTAQAVTCTQGTNNYTATFTAQYSGSGSGFQFNLFTRNDEDYLFIGNPELYKLDSNGNKTGHNLIYDPGFNSKEIYSSWGGDTTHPWFSNGSATKCEILNQAAGYFDTSRKMMVLHDKDWQFMTQEVATSLLSSGKQYKFSVDVIQVRTGSSGGAQILARTQSGSGWESKTLTKTNGTNTYTTTFTNTYSGSGTAFQFQVYTQDSSDYCVIGNPELYELDNSGNKVGYNLLMDPGFKSGISSDTWSSGAYPWFSNGSATTSTVKFVNQASNTFYYYTYDNRILYLSKAILGISDSNNPYNDSTTPYYDQAKSDGAIDIVDLVRLEYDAQRNNA